MNPYYHQTSQADARRERLMHEAEQDRLVRQDMPQQPGLADRVLANLGDWMVTEGTRLAEKRQNLTAQPHYKVLRSE